MPRTPASNTKETAPVQPQTTRNAMCGRVTRHRLALPARRAGRATATCKGYDELPCEGEQGRLRESRKPRRRPSLINWAGRCARKSVRFTRIRNLASSVFLSHPVPMHLSRLQSPHPCLRFRRRSGVWSDRLLSGPCTPAALLHVGLHSLAPPFRFRPPGPEVVWL